MSNYYTKDDGFISQNLPTLPNSSITNYEPLEAIYGNSGTLKVEDWKKEGNCCKELWEAQQPGTDNEQHGCAIIDCDGYYSAGFSAPFNYCPFCGKDLKNGKSNI